MPELVELKIYAQSIKDRFLHKAVLNSQCDKFFNFKSVTAGKSLTDVRANGKEIFFWFDGEPAFCVHLMLNGGFAVLNKNTRPAAADVIAELEFEGGEYLTVFDPDGYAKVSPFEFMPSVPEATAVTERYFYNLLSAKGRAAVKNVLCDQNLIRGIGNAYADEILYAANIHPFCKCGKIPPEARRELYVALIGVLEIAIERYGAMYKGVTCGEMRDFVRVHTKARFTPRGEIIKVAESGGRKTYFVASQRTFE